MPDPFAAAGIRRRFFIWFWILPLEIYADDI